TDLAPRDRFTKALKDMGGHTSQKEKGLRRATDHLQATRVEEEDVSVLRVDATNRSLELRGPLYLCYCCDGSRKVYCR
ncbi:hypothetical protein BVRB_016370, partial [Beta vulgaris subsp. vulgaris]